MPKSSDAEVPEPGPAHAPPRDPGLAHLSRLLDDSEDWLDRHFSDCAGRHGGDHEGAVASAAWRPPTQALSRSLAVALGTADADWERNLSPAHDSNSAASLGVAQARQQRRQGMKLPALLVLLKCCRQGYRDLFTTLPLSRSEWARCHGRMESYFDRLEIALCTEWSNGDADGRNTGGATDRLELLKALSDRVRVGLPASQVIAHAVSGLANRFAEYRVTYARMAEENRLQVLQSNQPSGMEDLAGLEIDLSRYPRYLAELRGSMPVMSEDLVRDPLFQGTVDRLTWGGAGATFDLPVRAGQALSGVLCVTAQTPRSWADDEVRTFTQVGEILNGACERETRDRAERALRETSLWLRSMFHALEEAVFLLTPGRELVDCNPSAERMFQYTRRELEYLSLEVLHVDRDHYIRFGKIMGESFSRNETASFDFPLKRKDGEVFAAEQSVALLRDPVAGSVGILAVVRDVAERRRAEQALKDSEQRLHQIIDFLPDPTWVIDEGGVVVAWNQAMERVSGVLSEQMVGKGQQEYSVPFYGIRRPVLIDLVSKPDPKWEATYLEFRRDGERLSAESHCTQLGEGGRYLASTATPLYDGMGVRVGAIESMRDITASKLLEQELHALATTDPLTGVLNRRRFLDRAREEFLSADRYGRELGFLMLDVDRFKRINDTHGHLIGDEVLRRLSEFCLQSLRHTDLFGRLGGEEFAAILVESGPEASASTAERLRAGMAEMAIPLERGTLQFTVSGGLAQLRVGDVSLEVLMQRADEALYAAKRGGRNRVVCVGRPETP